MPKHMVHPQGNGIAQNTKYEEMTKQYGIYISSKFAQKRKSSDNSKIEKGLKTTPKKNRELMIMLGMLICYMLWYVILWYDSLTYVMSWCVR